MLERHTADVKVVILAGGQGTRLAEETELRPKPMVDIGGRPILWHIMKHYARHGFEEFVIALGYRGEDIKRFFLDYVSMSGDLTVHLGERRVDRLHAQDERWTVHLVDTGLETATGGRVGKLAPWIKDERFMLTYGDGVSDVDLGGLLASHAASGNLATVTAVRPASRFGGLSFDDSGRVRFIEKPQLGEGWISGGFMVLEPDVLSYVDGDASSFESNVLEAVSEAGRLGAYRHEGFWQPMDTLRDVRYLRARWAANDAPWRTWE
jgi:glucose-1-phosphate cytidylyltransferase